MEEAPRTRPMAPCQHPGRARCATMPPLLKICTAERAVCACLKRLVSEASGPRVSGCIRAWRDFGPYPVQSYPSRRAGARAETSDDGVT